MKESSIFNAQRSSSSQILYCVLERFSTTPNRTMHGNKDWDGSNHLRFTEALTESKCEPMEFEWNIFPGFKTLQLSEEVKSLLLRSGETSENFTGRIFFMSMFNDISSGLRDNEKEVKCQSRSSICNKDLGKDNGHFLVLVLKRSGILSVKIVHNENGTYGGKDDVGIRRKRTSNFPCYKSVVQRSTQKQRPWKIVDTLLCRFGKD